ncbi:MAG: 8-amino-7-oxononanoate synthase [Akkermansia sp.]
MKNPQDILDQYRHEGLLRCLRTIDSLPHGLARMSDGALVVNLASNDYLGLAHHPALIEAMVRGLRDYGTGSTASRLVTGTRMAHTQLEEALAELKSAEAALSFSSGYTSSVGIIPAIVGKGDFIILDKLSHASLIDGAKLSGAEIHTFLHNDPVSLRLQLTRARDKSPNSTILVVTESIFSMDGDRAPLSEIVEEKDVAGALLLVDEAHGFGIIGERGAGLVSECGLSQRVEFQMGTLSKSAGLSGGYVACSRAWADLLINSSRSFIYSTSPAPALAVAALEAVHLISSHEGDEKRQNLSQLAHQLASSWQQENRPMSSIFPYIVGENEEALALSNHLLQQGYLAPAIRYPTVPKGTARLRITLTAAHSPQQVAGLISCLP